VTGERRDSAVLSRKIMLVAVEPSGDAIGAALIRELKTLHPEATFTGCGGPMMAAEGLESLFPIDALAVMGIADALRVLPEAAKRVEELTRQTETSAVSAVVFIDGWGFSRLCAEKMRKRAPRVKLFKLAAPQVWASRPKRVHEVRALFDGVLCLLPFEPPLFEKAGARAAFIGNPNFQKAWRARGDGARFRERHGLGNAPLLAVLPGSRKAELKRHLGPFGGAVRLLAQRMPGLRVVAIVPSNLEARAGKRIAKWPGDPIFAEREEKADAFAAADVALAKSGTVTTELAINGTPMAVAYKVDPLTAFWIRRTAVSPFVTILNVAAKREVIPEFLQEKCRADLLAAALERLLKDREARLDQLEAFPRLLAYLGVDGPDAAKLAAEKLLEWME
jgi:lipid-A-disaccharide synthase